MAPERVCDYPRPPRLEPSDEHIRVVALGQTLVETNRSLRVLETFHPPTYYLPPDAMAEMLKAVVDAPSCEWKGGELFQCWSGTGRSSGRWDHLSPPASGIWPDGLRLSTENGY